MANSKKTMRDWFLRGGERPSEEPKTSELDDGLKFAGQLICQNCSDNLADEEQCTHCGAPLQGCCPTDEYCSEDRICPECGHCWPSDTEQCPMCHSTLRAPDQKTYLVKVSQVKKCLWKGYVEVQAASRLEAAVKAGVEFETCGLDSWDLVDPELGARNGSDDKPVFSVEEPEES